MRFRRRNGDLRAGKQSLMVERRKQGAVFLKRAHAVETHGIQTLENVAPLPVLRGASVLFNEPLYLLEASNNALLTRRSPALLPRLRKFCKFCGEFVEIRATNSDLPSCNA